MKRFRNLAYVGVIVLGVFIIYFHFFYHSIELDEVNNSFENIEFINCRMQFNKDFFTLKYEDSYILQTGLVDTTDEQKPIRVAAFRIKHANIILNLKEADTLNKQIKEIYMGGKYTLTLIYSEKESDKIDGVIYKGNLIIENGTQSSNYNLEGWSCR